MQAVVTRGFGNGTYSGTIAEVVTRGYTIGDEVVVVEEPAFVHGGKGGGRPLGSGPRVDYNQIRDQVEIDRVNLENLTAILLMSGVLDEH